MVAAVITETSKTLALVGGYMCIVGLITFWFKDKFFLSEALVACVAGIAFGPYAASLFSPISWVDGDQEKLNYLTLQVTRIVIGLQVLFTGISLPKAYIWKTRLSLFTLLIPVMTAAWFISSLLVWGLIPGLTWLEALVVGSCVTPTDPVLANSICRGRFAEKYVPLEVRNILLAEAAANDGLGFPFLFMALYLILRKEVDHPVHSIGGAIGEWFYNIVLYQIAFSIVLGFIFGLAAMKALRYCKEKHLIDHEAFILYSVAITFFALGVVGMIGSDDLFCCFILGNAMTWDDFFREESEKEAFQECIDSVLNTGVFLFIGAVMPWKEFGNFWDITPWRLVVLGILILLLRRLPAVFFMSKWIPEMPTWFDAVFSGSFGPMGVGAIFYVQVGLEALHHTNRDRLKAVITPVVYFMVLSSIVVHGLSITFVKAVMEARKLAHKGKGNKEKEEPTTPADGAFAV